MLGEEKGRLTLLKNYSSMNSIKIKITLFFIMMHEDMIGKRRRLIHYLNFWKEN
jgi:hypothetical protein